MPMHTNGTTWDLLVSGDELAEVAKKRSKEFLEESVPNSQVGSYLTNGWAIKKQMKTKANLVKAKPAGSAFEDELWTIFYKMGFKVMNADSNFAVAYDEAHPTLSKQIDIIAIDDETCLFVECKEAQVDGTRGSFPADIAEIEARQDKYYREISKKYPDRKFKYIFAVKNYIVGDQDKARLSSARVTFFDYNAVLYYKALAAHLGSAARFQLLGSLFAGTTIKGMNGKVPAIRGTMGDLTYYTFLIEPENLLKIGYVLHRTNANNDYEELLPSYQRLIKKDRLRSVQEFIDAGGYFPNSLIISVDSKKPMQFDDAPKSVNGDSTAVAGTLHLPQTYQSAYIIDGQHRLYGYSDSQYAATNTVPVVAFERLSKDKQLRLFMEINENQKAVSKSLRNILEIDIYNDSEDPNLRKRALLGRIGKRLGEDPKSPLHGRVIIGEDAQTEKCCITLESLKIALDKTHFFNRYKRNGTIIESGLFDKGTNNETLAVIYPLLVRMFSDIREYCSDEWNATTDAYLTKNNAIIALIRIFDDIVNIVLEKEPSLASDPDQLYKASEDFILLLGETLNTLPAEKRRTVREARGTAVSDKPYRTIQVAMHEANPSFTNPAIEQYYLENCINYNDQAKAEIVAIKAFLVDFTRKIFPEEDWLSLHAAEEHEKELTARVNNKAIANRRNGIAAEVNAWTELTILDVVKILQNGANWSDYYKDMFKSHGVDATKVEIVTKLRTIHDLEIKINNGTHITLTNYNELKALYSAIIGE